MYTVTVYTPRFVMIIIIMMTRHSFFKSSQSYKEGENGVHDTLKKFGLLILSVDLSMYVFH